MKWNGAPKARLEREILDKLKWDGRKEGTISLDLPGGRMDVTRMNDRVTVIMTGASGNPFSADGLVALWAVHSGEAVLKIPTVDGDDSSILAKMDELLNAPPSSESQT